MFNPARTTPAHRCTDIVESDSFTVGCSRSSPLKSKLLGMDVITPDTSDFYASIDVYVHFPDDDKITALTAMAYAIPVVSMSSEMLITDDVDVSITVEVDLPITDGIDGFIVKNTEQLTKILKKAVKRF